VGGGEAGERDAMDGGFVKKKEKENFFFFFGGGGGGGGGGRRRMCLCVCFRARIVSISDSKST